MREIKPLTSLRGIFALWVLLFHLGAWSPRPGYDATPIIMRGYLGVDLFFMLSGFVLAASYGGAFLSGRLGPTYVRFIIRRAARLFPLHWVVMLGACLEVFFAGLPQYWWGYIAGEAALIHRWNIGFAPTAALNVPDWSISTEWAANLIFPVFAWLTLGLRDKGSVLVAAATFGLLTYVASSHGWRLDGAMAHSFLPLLRCFAEFAIGMLVYRWRDRWPVLHGDAAIAVLSVIATLLALVPKSDLAFVAVTAALLYGLAGNAGVAKRWMSIRPLHYLGEISYSLYLVQIPILLLVRMACWSIPDATVQVVVYAIGTIITVITLAGVTYQVLELRVKRTMHRYDGKVMRFGSANTRLTDFIQSE